MWLASFKFILADNNYSSPGAIDLILETDVYFQIWIENGIIKGDSPIIPITNSPIAQRTIFGWIIFDSSCSTAFLKIVQDSSFYGQWTSWSPPMFLEIRRNFFIKYIFLIY